MEAIAFGKLPELPNTRKFRKLQKEELKRLVKEEFEEAKRVLSETPFFSTTESGRLQVADSIRGFINTDLKQIWEQQKQSKKP